MSVIKCTGWVLNSSCQKHYLRIISAFYFLLTLFSVHLISVNAADRTNIPLKNWGGFAIERSWIYDALEKIVLAGLADHAILNTKPISRMEAARVIAQAVRKLEQNQYGDYNDRGYLEDLLYQLVKEFGPELAEMGVKTHLNYDAKTGFLSLKPIDHVQFGSTYANNSQTLINQSGQGVNKGVNGDLTMDGRGGVGDYVSLYYQPEFSVNEDDSQGRLQVGYGKLTFLNTEIEVGRDSLWWGPGFRGSMLFSNNASPLNQVRIGSAEPFLLPSFLSYIGPMKATFLVGQLGDRSQNPNDFPDAMVGAYRLSMAPFKYVEIGHGRSFQFGGDGRGFTFADFPGALFQTTTSEGADNPNNPRNINNLLSFDITIRIPNVQRYIFIARDAAIYGEMGYDDTKHGFIIPNQPGGLVGTYLTGFLWDPYLDLRLEYAQSTPIMFTHHLYKDGYTYKDAVLSHFIGTDGSELYGRLTHWITHDILVGFDASRARIGSTQYVKKGAEGPPREKRDSLGLDVSYRFTECDSIFIGYDLSRITNRGFIADDPEFDHIFGIEYTHAF